MKNVHISDSDQWKYIDIKSHESFINKIINFIQEFFSKFFKIKIIKIKNFGFITDKQNFLISQNIKKRKYSILSNVIYVFLKGLKIKVSKQKIIKLIKNHDNIYYKKNPIESNYGGIGYNNSLFLYIFFKNSKAKLIIESGVWKGFVSYIIDQAFKKIKKIKFDINFSKLIYKSKNSEYFEDDISFYDFKEKKIFKNSIIFFDDHMNQLDRFLLADNLGINSIIFDDDINYEAVHSDGWPSLPTISMVREKRFIKKMKWCNNGRIGVSNFNVKFNKRIFKKYIFQTAPNISYITGYYIQTPMTFIKKR